MTPRSIETWMKRGLPYRKYSGRIAIPFRLAEVEEFFDRPHLVSRQRS